MKTLKFGSLLLLFFSLFSMIDNDKYGIKSDDYYMRIIIDSAKKVSGAPFLAAIVDKSSGEILSVGVNDYLRNPILHGEMDAINKCVQKHPDVDWKNTILYTTAEPCPMCMSCIVWAGIPRVVYGASINTLKESGYHQIDIFPEYIIEKSVFYNGTIEMSPLSNECDLLFQKK
ncbi:MAG: nucleoside deaminase [Hyphomicrobiales bacterium]